MADSPETQQAAAAAGAGDDLAEGLFANKNHAMANVLRELQERNVRANRAKAADCVTNKDDDCDGKSDGDGSNLSLGSANGSALWVLGGATTVIDRQGVPEGANKADASKPEGKGAAEQPNAQCDGAEPQVSASVDLNLKSGDVNAKGAAEKLASRSRVRMCFSDAKDACQALAEIVCLYPGTLVAPILIFLLLAGLGVWGVMAGAAAHVTQRKDDARSRAVDAATGFQIQLQQSFTPGLTFTLLVKQNPNLEYWIANFNSTAEELMSRVPKGSLWNLQLQPFAQVMMIHPFRAPDITQVAPPRDLLGDPGRRDDILKIISTREPMVVGPVTLSDNSTGAFVRYPIYISDVSAEETFGFRYFYPNATSTQPLPYSELPASVRNCSVCYNATSREKWWGLMTVLVNYDAVSSGEDAYLANLRKMGFHYALVRQVNSTYEQVIAQVGPSSLRDRDAVTVDVNVVNNMWLLRVSPSGGFEPPWRGPLIAAVIIIALIISILLFVSTASFKRQALLLNETVAANRNLAETTKRLEEEKERMDVLLVRQYELLRCLDANRGGGTGDAFDALGSSRKAMMARIEDARRSLNVAKANQDDNIQVFEVLGAGAFGKVQKGLWRGTVVAVKTMILPANMTGQEKREKMAVMEAAISSSLVHPNIVTTYTYFIRPYHEPAHSNVHQMLASYVSRSNSLAGGGEERGGSRGSMGDSTSSEATVHSYEVRLVLEFCDKGSLKDALDQHAFMQGEGFNLAAMLETASDIAKAMVHMHAANVLHSDLKARNIMLKSSGTEGRGVIAKVADFGLSTRMEHTETHLSSCFQGTLTHMAPEVMLEGRISKAADVYSFGILMWELFCAGDPFSGVPRAHLGHAITMKRMRPKFPPFAPRDYVALAARCWDPDAAARPTFELVLSELVRMREELGGGATQPLQIAPPPPITTQQSADGGVRRSPNSGAGGGWGSAAGGLAATQRLPNGGGVSLGNGGASTLYGAGIVLGPLSNAGVSSSGGGGGSGCSSVVLTLGSSQGPPGYRARMKLSVAQRHLRKMGIRLGGGGSTGLAQTLPALQEDSEHKEV
ncbi:hypothetical protein PLESTB_000202500 [Pleodorina starrii]|uniref:Protein kinase domain-containing protein n=1 Tax=Pleodorina starrii TaxID=330485 RepID=A0A9W6BCI8_9CHLO|nr:hypothetical protein PLESTM_000329200 [Pleodorina starrii]GLC49285.1 hypothetical protein PLESTB_000202500 [Pleodorina starrii]GLC73457.1 hypothetical protein PLESTF_001377800 [Pleodorina starrii]